VTRKKAFQSSVVRIPVYINGLKAGMLVNGGTLFLDVPAGTFFVHVGPGKQGSEKLHATLGEKTQLRFEAEISLSLLQAKWVLRQLPPPLPIN
jgi:hypothetical protein